MIVRRLALFLALVFGGMATQVPSFVAQYEQALGGAIGELAAIVSAFDMRSARQGLSEADAIRTLRANADPLVRGEGDEKDALVQRLHKLQEAQAAFRNAGPVMRLSTFATHYDERVAEEAWNNFQPALPVTPEAFVLGLAGFLIGGGAMHVAGRPFRRRRTHRLRETGQIA